MQFVSRHRRSSGAHECMLDNTPIAKMVSAARQRVIFQPKADATVVTAKNGAGTPLPTPMPTIVFDADNLDKPLAPWPADAHRSCYPIPADPYAAAPVPGGPGCPRPSERYLRAYLHENERLRLSMLWYYTRDILQEHELISGLNEKAVLAQETTGWEYVVIGLLDVHVYIRLATVGLPLAVLPRGETLCAHTVTQPPGSVFLLPNMQEDWRFQDSPYVERGGLLAYAGVPLRVQHESGDTVGLGSLCVASSTPQEPLTKSQHLTLARLADWLVQDIVQCTRARRQRERRRMADLIAAAQKETEVSASDEPVMRILKAVYPDAITSVQSSTPSHIELPGRTPILLSDLEDGVWEDVDCLDDHIANSNQRDLPSATPVRVMAAPCESISGPSLLVVASKDFRLVFDDVDTWFVKTCASMLSHMWQRCLLAEAMKAKEKFIRGISHQLRTPIHGILGSVDLLAEELKARELRGDAYRAAALLEASAAVAPTEPSVYLDTIKTAGRDLISIVNNMITLNRWADIAITRRQYGVHTVFELEAALAKDVLKTTAGETRYRPSVILSHDLPLEGYSFRIDLSLLRDSLVPIIVNAIQSTSEGVVAVTISMRPDSKELAVDVQDNGRGIHPDNQQRIFELYETANLQTPGAGLGLSLACKFATLLHGSIDLVSSTLGAGSHFRATFRDVEWVCLDLPSQPLSTKLANLPSKFHTVPRPDGTSLCGYFSKFLFSHGFTNSGGGTDRFCLLDFVPDREQLCALLAQIPPNQVVVCLVSTPDADVYLEQTHSNVVFVSGPFSTTTMSATLEAADTLLSQIRASQSRLLSSDAIPSPLPTPGEDTSTDTDMTKPLDLPLRLALPPRDIPSNPALHGVALLDVMTPPATQTMDPFLFAPIISPRPRALLVDDNDVNLRIMAMYCRKRGLPYRCATDGAQAVEIFSQSHRSGASGDEGPIELILMDLQMPVCDGIEATRQIRSLEKQNNWRASILFIVTGQDSPTDRSAADGVRADDYFVKPVSIKVLDRNIKRHFPAFEVS
ncbi:hypothetical protein GQ53DRAFT_703049 [Thozetella sp. PMI_491]|nr:hypothetical protein GQ53DRAFT_703049 [Thozetella sp. PMI_491]